MKSKSHVPQDTHPLVAYLTIDKPAEALDFYTKAFGATEIMRLVPPGSGTIMHAEMEVAGCRFYMGSETPQMDIRGPTSLGGTSVTLVLYVPDCDGTIKQAIKAGATLRDKPADMFWGDRMGQVQDPFGHRWTIATHLRDPSPAEMERGMAEMAKGGCG